MEKSTKVRLLLGCIAVPAGLVVILVIGGFALPSTFEVSRSIVIDAPPAAIHPHIASLRAWEAWSPWVEDEPEMTMTYSGPELGVGSSVAFQSPKGGDGSMQITAADPESGVTFHLAMDGFALDGELTYEPDGESTTVTWTDSGHLGNNPLFRYMGAVMDSMVGGDLERGLAGIKREAENSTPDGE